MASGQTAGTSDLARWLRAANWDAGLGLHCAGTLRVPGRAPICRPDLQGCFDLIGFSYYATLGVRDGRIVPYPADAARYTLGYHIWADELRPVLDRLHTQVPDTPILVAEFGVGTRDGQVRGDYITRCIQITSDAIARGIDIRGMFRWISVDNYAQAPRSSAAKRAERASGRHLLWASDVTPDGYRTSERAWPKLCSDVAAARRLLTLVAALATAALTGT